MQRSMRLFADTRLVVRLTFFIFVYFGCGSKKVEKLWNIVMNDDEYFRLFAVIRVRL